MRVQEGYEKGMGILSGSVNFSYDSLKYILL